MIWKNRLVISSVLVLWCHAKSRLWCSELDRQSRMKLATFKCCPCAPSATWVIGSRSWIRTHRELSEAERLLKTILGKAACLTCQSYARVLPKEFSHWFCSQTPGLQLSLEYLGMIARWQAGATNKTQTWILQPDQQNVRLLENLWLNCVEFV